LHERAEPLFARPQCLRGVIGSAHQRSTPSSAPSRVSIHRARAIGLSRGGF
jgi:hypothetical protein